MMLWVSEHRVQDFHLYLKWKFRQQKQFRLFFCRLLTVREREVRSLDQKRT